MAVTVCCSLTGETSSLVRLTVLTFLLVPGERNIACPTTLIWLFAQESDSCFGHLLSPVHCFPGEPRVLSKRPILGFDHLVGNCLEDECTEGLPDAVLQDKDCRRLLKAWLCAASPVCWSIFLPFFYSIPSVPCRKHSTANPEEILTLM